MYRDKYNTGSIDNSCVESKPTKKGLTLQPATWTEVLRAVQVFLGSGSDADADDLGDDTDPFAGDV